MSISRKDSSKKIISINHKSKLTRGITIYIQSKTSNNEFICLFYTMSIFTQCIEIYIYIYIHIYIYIYK